MWHRYSEIVKNLFVVMHVNLGSFLLPSRKDEWTVHLPIWSNPGSYAVTVQIVSDHCPSQTGCHVSVSPKFGKFILNL